MIAILTISSGVVAASAVSGVPKLFPAETEWASASDWGTGADESPTFTPDGKTVYFAHEDAEKRAIMVSHLRNGAWSAPKPATFSGTWRDFAPAIAPDGSYLVFDSNRPTVAGGKSLEGYFGGQVRPGKGGDLWRVDKALATGRVARVTLPCHDDL